MRLFARVLPAHALLPSSSSSGIFSRKNCYASYHFIRVLSSFLFPCFLFETTTNDRRSNSIEIPFPGKASHTSNRIVTRPGDRSILISIVNPDVPCYYGFPRSNEEQSRRTKKALLLDMHAREKGTRVICTGEYAYSLVSSLYSIH